ncbi:MAG: branched-chain amino acid ABC transporter permease [Betaproteobacteria bacterium]|nr:branched-chain amino acid ABC transporter permease [Betaproteobacteria bacterium]MBI2961316.1 branched-chain amino acid ABC transporter permease [Betaproteobacteria bacterium]
MNIYFEGVLASMGINILLALSAYAILATDRLSLGNAGFMAIGAYCSSYLTVNAGWDLLPALSVSAFAAAAVGLLVGLPVLRLQGIYFVMGTLAFGEIVRTFFQNFEPTGGAYGMRGMFGASLAMIYAFVAAFLILFVLYGMSRAGRSSEAVRDDDEAARSIGINVVAVRLASFAWGALIAGVAGALFAHYALYIESGNFNFLVSANAILFVILGGVQTVWGALLGAVLFTLLPEALRFLADWRMTVYGAILVALMASRPEGILTRDSLRALKRLAGRKA